jgi:hypothetical protein
MVAERSKGVFGTLTYPHLILAYSAAYYGHLASHYAWGSLVLPYLRIACWCDYGLEAFAGI